MTLRPVDPSDEQPHASSDELGWSESYSFYVVDPSERLGLLSRIGVRPNEGIMDVGLDVYVADGGLLAARHVRPQSENTADLEVEGISYELVRPLEEWRIRYDGPAHSLRSSRDASSHDAWHKSRLERLIVDLTFHADGPPAATDEVPGRFGQAGRFRGEVWVSGDEYRLDCPGVRERVWGGGAAQVPQLRRRIWARFEDGSALVVDRRADDGRDSATGWLLQGGEQRAITSARFVTETEPDTYWQKSVQLSCVDDGGEEHTVEIEILQLAPLPTVRGATKVVVCSSLGACRWGSRAGFAVVEYLHQLDEGGAPILPVSD